MTTSRFRSHFGSSTRAERFATMPKRRAPEPDGHNRRTGGVRQRLRQGTDEVGAILQVIDMLAAHFICVQLFVIVSVGPYVFYCLLFDFSFCV